MIKLQKMSLKELKQLQKDIANAIETYRDRQKAEAIAELEAIAREKGFTLSELSNASRKIRKPVPPKYAHPDNPSVTWSGRGRKPKWITEALAAGKSLDDLAI